MSKITRTTGTIEINVVEPEEHVHDFYRLIAKFGNLQHNIHLSIQKFAQAPPETWDGIEHCRTNALAMFNAIELEIEAFRDRVMETHVYYELAQQYGPKVILKKKGH